MGTYVWLFCIFGSPVFAYKLYKRRAGKFERPVEERILVGYCRESTFHVLLLDGKTILESRDVKFCENENLEIMSTEIVIEFGLSDLDIILDDKADQVTCPDHNDGPPGASRNDCGNSESLVLESESRTKGVSDPKNDPIEAFTYYSCCNEERDGLLE